MSVFNRVSFILPSANFNAAAVELFTTMKKKKKLKQHPVRFVSELVEYKYLNGYLRY